MSRSAATIRKRKAATWTVAAVLVLSFVAPFAGLLPQVQAAYAQRQAAEAAGDNPRSEYWREVRGAQSGYTAVTGAESGVLVNSSGQNWRLIRNGWIASVAPWLLLAVLVALGAYHAKRGRNMVDRPLSGRKVLRWKTWERAAHFAMAGLFIILAITGLSLLFGRAILIPILGKDAFAAFASFAKDVHNYLGPAFAAVLAFVVLAWMRHNFFNAHDVAWLKKWGGLFGGSHPHAGRMNGGEKVWFWIVALVGGAVCISGFVLDFPNFGQTRETMQVAHVIHAALAAGWIAVAFGHIYIGTLGTEGALEGMTTGYVSEEWARQHHDLWLDEIQKEGQNENPSGESAVAAEEPRT